MRVRLSLSLPVCLSQHIIFPPNKHFTCFTTFRLCGNSFLQSRRARALSPAAGLVAGNQRSHCHRPTSVSGREPKPCFKPCRPRPPEIKSRADPPSSPPAELTPHSPATRPLAHDTQKLLKTFIFLTPWPCPPFCPLSLAFDDPRP